MLAAVLCRKLTRFQAMELVQHLVVTSQLDLKLRISSIGHIPQ